MITAPWQGANIAEVISASMLKVVGCQAGLIAIFAPWTSLCMIYVVQCQPVALHMILCAHET